MGIIALQKLKGWGLCLRCRRDVARRVLRPGAVRGRCYPGCTAPRPRPRRARPSARHPARPARSSRHTCRTSHGRPRPPAPEAATNDETSMS